MLEKSRFKIANVALIESTQSSNSLESTTPLLIETKFALRDLKERERDRLDSGFWILELKYVLEDLKKEHIYEL